MQHRSFESFLSRIWLFLGLVATYLLLLQGLHSVGQYRGHRRVETAVAERAKSAAQVVLGTADATTLLAELREYEKRGVLPGGPALSRSELQVLGVRSVELLTADGWGLKAAERPQASRPTTRPDLDDSDFRRLSAGEPVADVVADRWGPVQYATIFVYQPVLDERGRLKGVLRVDVEAEQLAVSRRELTWNLALTTASLVAFLLLLVLFTRWTIRPLKLLARTAASPDDAANTDELARQDDTGFVIETYRRMIAQLQEKEQELRRMRQVERNRADELQELNASIVDSMVAGALILDLSGRIRSMNEACRQVLAVPGGRVVGRPYRDVLPHVPDLHAKLQACLDEALVIRREEMRLSLPGVGRRDVDLTLSPLRDRDGARTGALCLFVDLTEVKALQEQVRLKASLAELGELSAGIAHEFRNSLGSILGYAKLMERQAPPDILENAKAIRLETQALGKVVDDFLRFANPTRLVIEPVDLQALLAELSDDVVQRARGRTVHFAVAPGLPTLSGDETLLKRTFTNLLRNAVDAVGDGGRVQVSAESAPGMITLHVDDDGPGIPMADREKVFTPFFTRKEHGTGLGLALARKVVVHHGGRISVDVSPLGGARFSVSLPIRGDAPG